jgi:membrane protease YdiL (CAAX protease family)
MSDSPSPTEAGPVEPWPPDGARLDATPAVSARRALFEVLVCSSYPTQIVMAVALDLFGLRGQHANGALNPAFLIGVAIGDSLLVTALIVWFLRRRGESLRALVCGTRPVLREAVTGLGLVPVVMLGVSLVIAAVRVVAPAWHNVPDNPLTALMVDRLTTIVLGLVVVVAGGLREELQRAFQLHRLTPTLMGPGFALVLTSAAFGLGHTVQGYDVAVGTAALGCFWGAMFLRRRSVVAAAVCHALFNLGQVALAWVARQAG